MTDSQINAEDAEVEDADAEDELGESHAPDDDASEEPAVAGRDAKKRDRNDDAAIDPDVGGSDAATDVLERSGGGSEMNALRGEFEDLNDRHLRLVAEFNNYRRRSEQERLSAWSRAQADLVGKFIDVLDDLHRVAELDLSNATVEAIMEGIDLVERKFVRIVQDAGVEMLDPAGAPFDPELMEAVMRVPAETSEQVDTVAQVFQKGYSLKGILVRPARVSVYTEG